MRYRSGLGDQTNELVPGPVDEDYKIEGFNANYFPKEVYIEDTVHVLVRLKTRLLKVSILLPIGDYSISASHLKFLEKYFTKDQHLLTPSDFESRGKMKFKSAIKMCDPRVIKLLKKVPGSEGTQAYLKLMNFVALSFLSSELNPLMRAYCIWYSAFFLRYWRQWLSSKNNKFTVESNFLSDNTYLCIELNAHGMTNLLMKQLENDPQQVKLLPWQNSSQPCEGFFCTLRLYSSTFAMAVNCSTLEVSRKSQRLQFIGDIQAHDFSKNGHAINFPRTTNLNASFEKLHSMKLCVDLDKEEMFNCELALSSLRGVIKRAKEDAFKCITRLGVTEVAIGDALTLHVKPTHMESGVDRDVDEDNSDPEKKLMTTLDGIKDPLQLEDYSAQHPEVKEDDPWVFVDDGSGSPKIVRKSSICYYLEQNCEKISSDRCLRVQQSEIDKKAKGFQRSEVIKVGKLDKICIFDWCVFKEPDTEKCLIGHVLSFAYLDQGVWRDTEFSKDFLQVTRNVAPNAVEKTIGVHCTWYTINRNMTLKHYKKFLPGYFFLNSYKSTIPLPEFGKNGTTKIPQSVYIEIKDAMRKN
ncbi:hypothetical protein QAD02_012673 [Eretmocerus hayati]|uniref:Uncharacterized protein n=1 Tax=Eretmocerus hayati TaxID=131215 RepID=A0ACC2P235_9HYME|nr:hypothetical protein QAD02_012673 [Eretmocerus hayati]